MRTLVERITKTLLSGKRSHFEGRLASSRPLTCEPLEDRRMMSGVTLLTHGLQVGGTYPGWIDAMAQEVGNRIQLKQPGDTWSWYHVEVTNQTPINGPIEKHSPSTPDASEATSGEIVLTLDWSTISGLGTAGNTQLVAEVVTTTLLSTYPSIGIDTPLAELPIHLIGHSRGASVVGALAEDLGQAGIWVDHVTYLDTHPIDGDPDDWGDNDFHVTENIVFADSYYREGNVLLPNGEYVDGWKSALKRDPPGEQNRH